ncbi:NAD(P)-binding protein [Ceraceosorus guamensis]|uniref:NAD(P)-binding protein n=1 Tax=Ceraceosorus guamensis TaxID=1522189 RepID=A0A316W7W3_9BASI|nr:NAD(P)-binding protein [Ceraceosorus guamensis]PWN44143.1 NAD(P)-binding protein [Ceraceosorus guamensis]
MSSLFGPSRLQDKVVLITGASGGIGAATAILFARAGANVILTARRASALSTIQSRCVEAHNSSGLECGGLFQSLTLDVSKSNDISHLASRLPSWAKDKVDILVNNAGLVLGVEKVGEIEEEEVNVMIDTNVKGLIGMTQLFINQFKQRGSGHIIQIGSVAGVEAYPGGSIYCATKYAVRAFTSALRKEVVDTKIRITEIQPGLVASEGFSLTRFRGDQQKADQVYSGLQPLSSEDVAEEIVWAANRPAHVQIAESLIFPTNQAGPRDVARPLLDQSK